MTQVAEGPQASAGAPAVRKKHPRGRVHVFDNWCKGCGICIEFCPQHVFDIHDDGRPIVARADDCTGCEWCEVHCPDLAIMVTKLDEEGADGRQTDAGE